MNKIFSKTAGWLLAAAVSLVIILAVPLKASAHHTAPDPPTNLTYGYNSKSGQQALGWQPPSRTYVGLYYIVYLNGVRVGDTSTNDSSSPTAFSLNDTSKYGSGTYTVRSADRLDGYETVGSASNAVTVNLGYNWTRSGSPWSSCFTPGAPTPAGQYDGCFAAGTSMYALRNINVKYGSAASVLSGSAYIHLNYQQKFSALPTWFTKYDVNLIVGSGTNWQYVTTLQLPAAGPGVPQTYSAPVNIPINHPGEVELQWVNDSVNSGGDANLQIDSFNFFRPGSSQ
jgi:hypothetical protein